MYNNNYDRYCALYIFTISARASSARRVNGQRRRAVLYGLSNLIRHHIYLFIDTRFILHWGKTNIHRALGRLELYKV